MGTTLADGVGYSDTNAMDNDQAIVRPAKGEMAVSGLCH